MESRVFIEKREIGFRRRRGIDSAHLCDSNRVSNRVLLEPGLVVVAKDTLGEPNSQFASDNPDGELEIHYLHSISDRHLGDAPAELYDLSGDIRPQCRWVSLKEETVFLKLPVHRVKRGRVDLEENFALSRLWNRGVSQDIRAELLLQLECLLLGGGHDAGRMGG